MGGGNVTLSSAQNNSSFFSAAAIIGMLKKKSREEKKDIKLEEQLLSCCTKYLIKTGSLNVKVNVMQSLAGHLPILFLSNEGRAKLDPMQDRFESRRDL